MAATTRIASSDREFFEVISQIAFCNPFSEHRLELDAKILGHPVGRSLDEHLDEFSSVIIARIQKLESHGPADLRRYSAADRELMQTVLLLRPTTNSAGTSIN